MEAEEIKEIRVRLGLSQREIGKMVGATKTSWYKWEKGRSKPHPMFVEKILELAKESK